MIHQHQNRDEGQAVLRELDAIHIKKKNLWTYQHVELHIAFNFPKAIYHQLLTTHSSLPHTCKLCKECRFLRLALITQDSFSLFLIQK